MRKRAAQLFFPDPPPVLYHYCSADTFMKIIQSHQLWLTDFSKMNDYAEESWAADMVAKSYEKRMWKRGISRCFKAYYHSEYSRRRTSIRKFLCCFSENGDSLSQWRAYADNGSGFAIGFDSLNLNSRRNIPTPSLPEGKLKYLLKICYDSNRQAEFIEECLDADSNKRKVDNLTTANMLAFLSIAMKNSAFLEESEWRIVYAPLFFEKNIDNITNSLYFINNRRGLVPYFTHVFDYNAISNVVIGPTNQTTEEDLQLFLRNYNFNNINILRANATYRG